MKIIDFETKGNVVRFALGADDGYDYWGDDWDDAPYEHNAGEVYERYVQDYATIMFPFNYVVLTPEDDYHYQGGSPFCKDDFKKRKAPCVIAIELKDDDYDWNIYYSKDALRDDIVKFFFEDKIKPGIYLYDNGLKKLQFEN